LSDFFIERDGLYFHKRCDFEIQRFKDKSDKAKQSIKTRWNKNKELDTNTNVLPTNNEGNTNQLTNKPINLLTNKPIKNMFTVPDWIPLSAWEGFIEFRKAAKGAFTDRAKQLIINKLKSMKDEGQDVAKVLDQSTANGWKGVFPLQTTRGEKNGKFNVHAAGREMLARSLAEENMDSRTPRKVQDAVHDQVHLLLSRSADD
jgi:hypothetical protein